MTDEAQEPAGLRPSQIREVQAGATSWTTVDVVDAESGLGGPLRPALETFGIRVERTPVGQGRHLFRALSRESPAPFVVLACHGDEGDVVLPELAPELERTSPSRAGSPRSSCAPSPASTAPP